MSLNEYSTRDLDSVLVMDDETGEEIVLTHYLLLWDTLPIDVGHIVHHKKEIFKSPNGDSATLTEEGKFKVGSSGKVFTRK